MNRDTESTREELCIFSPYAPKPGMLAAMARPEKLDEIKELESSGQKIVWKVRGIISDSVPLSGEILETLKRPAHNLLFLNEDPLTIYLHAGGKKAVYYDFVGDKKHNLQYIEVRVESRLPSVALLLARRPLNAMLDVITRNFNLPLTLQRLEILSPKDGGILVSQALLPTNTKIVAGPLGGIVQSVPFAPYDAIYREALTSSSPFYRLLCAARMYEGTNTVRKWIKERCVERGIQDRLPSDPPVTQEELKEFGFAPETIHGVRTTQDLFHKLRDMRDAIAHFLIEREAGDVHVYLAEGAELERYATAAVALLHYAHNALESLRRFYTDKLESHRGMVLPMIENRQEFIVRASDLGYE
jgi:hypothetical protein